MSGGGMLTRIVGAAPGTVLALLAASGMLLWEEGRISPADGEPQARLVLLIATTVWALMFALSARMRLRDLARSTESTRRWTPTGLVAAAAAGAASGAGLFLVMIPPSDVRWQAYMAAMRSDLGAVVEAQQSHVRQHGQPAIALEEVGLLASEGVLIELRSGLQGWSASARHVDMPNHGYPDALCIVFGGDVAVSEVHRLSDGRIPQRAGERICEWGRYARVSGPTR